MAITDNFQASRSTTVGELRRAIKNAFTLLTRQANEQLLRKQNNPTSGATLPTTNTLGQEFRLTVVDGVNQPGWFKGNGDGTWDRISS